MQSTAELHVAQGEVQGLHRAGLVLVRGNIPGSQAVTQICTVLLVRFRYGNEEFGKQLVQKVAEFRQVRQLDPQGSQVRVGTEL